MRIAYMRSPFRGPVIPDDGGTVAHVYFNGSQLVDKYGNAWTQNGTVPQVARRGRIPAGAGAFSDANYYSLGTGNDVLDFAGDFSACIVFTATDVAAPVKVLFSNGASSVAGYYLQQAAGGAGTIAFSLNAAGSNLGTSAPGAPVIVGFNVVCFGRTGTNGAIKVNLGTYATAAGPAITPATANVAFLGRYNGGGNPASADTIYEAWFSNSTPSDQAFTAIMQRVHSRLQITAW